MHVGEDAAEGDEEDGDQHEGVEGEAGGAVFEVFRENDDGEEEDSGGEHGVGAGERGLAGAVGAVVEDPDFFENDVGHDQEGEREEGPAEFGVDFAEGFAAKPLDEGQESETGGGDQGESDDEVGQNEPKSGGRVGDGEGEEAGER